MPMLTTNGDVTAGLSIRDEGPRFLNIKQVIFMTGLSRATIYRQMEKGTFPPSRSITDHRIGWLYQEIIDWLDSRPRRNVTIKH